MIMDLKIGTFVKKYRDYFILNNLTEWYKILHTFYNENMRTDIFEGLISIGY